MTVFDLGDISLIVDRADAHPAPTSDIPPRTGDNQVPSRIGPQTVPFKACGCLDGDLCTHPCDGTRDRIELAYAPVLYLGRAA